MLRVPIAIDHAVPLGSGQGAITLDGVLKARIGLAAQPQIETADKRAMPEQQAWLQSPQQEAVWS